MQQVYYSSWLWMTIHIIISIPNYQTEDKIATHLGIKKEKVLKFLKQLRKFNLVNYQDGKWYHSGGNIHLNRESPLNSINHNNWRQQAVLKSQTQNQNNIHYTSVFSLTLKDYEELQQMIFKFINESRNVISKSKEEILACFTCDFFKV